MDKYCYCILVLILWRSPKHTTGSLHLEYDTERQRVTDCLTKLLSKEEYVTIIDADQMLDLAALHALRQGSRFVSQAILWKSSLLQTKTYLIASRTCEKLAERLNSLKYEYFWNPSAFFVIFVEHLESGLQKLSQLLLENNIFKVVVVKKNEQDYDIYTYRKNFNACNRSEVLVVASQCDIINGKNIVPVSINITLRGCTFKLIAQNRWPLINFQKPKGLENTAIALFEEHNGLKFQLIVHEHDVSVPFPAIPEGFRNNSVELVIGGYVLVLFHASRYSFSYPIVSDSLILAIRHSDFLSSWQATFGLNIVLISIIIITFIVYCFISIRFSLFPTRERDITRNILIVLGYFLNKITVKNIRPHIAYHIIFATMLFFVFIIPYIIQGYLYSVTTHPLRDFELRDRQEIVTKFKVLLPEGWNVYNFTGRICSSIINCLDEVKNNKHENLYTLITKEQLYAYAARLVDDQCKNVLYILADPYASILRTFYFRRGSILVKPFNNFLLQSCASGLLGKAYDDFVYNELLKCKPKYKPNTAPLSVWDIKEAFTILFIGYIISIITFILEYKLKRT